MGIIDLSMKGIWLLTLNDNSKWVVDFDNNLFDNYKWYKAMGTLESELNWEELKREVKTMRRI